MIVEAHGTAALLRTPSHPCGCSKRVATSRGDLKFRPVSGADTRHVSTLRGTGCGAVEVCLLRRR